MVPISSVNEPNFPPFDIRVAVMEYHSTHYHGSMTMGGWSCDAKPNISDHLYACMFESRIFVQVLRQEAGGGFKTNTKKKT